MKILKTQILVIVGIICISMTPKDFARSQTNPKDFKCLVELWNRESRWNYKSISATHDYGIPQRHMPRHTKAEIDEFLRSPIDQVKWGLGYLKHRYSSEIDPTGICSGLKHSHRKGWY